MLDREYFDKYLRDQIARLGGARVVVYLHNGAEFTIASIEDVLDGYVCLEVYSQGAESKKAQKERKRYDVEDPILDRVAIPYSSIAYVWLTRTAPTKSGGLGFHSDDSV